MRINEYIMKIINTSEYNASIRNKSDIDNG